MAALDCNAAPNTFPASENREISEEKPLNIDYSEDLWLANSEDSSGAYPQHPGKVSKAVEKGSAKEDTQEQEVMEAEEENGETLRSEHPLTQGSAPGPANLIKDELAGGDNTQTSADHGKAWVGGEPSVPVSAAMQANSAAFMNGVEENGIEFASGSEDPKDFAQLVPAGSYVEGAGLVGENKTFTALMPAAGLGTNGEIPPEFTPMVNVNHEQMVYYGAGEPGGGEGGQTAMEEAPAEFQRHQEHMSQLAAVNPGEGQGEVGEVQGGAVYVTMDNLGQEVAGATTPAQASFHAMSPSVTGVASNSSHVSEEQVFTTSAATTVTNYHNISTLPFVQNGAAFTSDAGFSSSSSSSYHQASAVVNGNSVAVTVGQEYVLDQSTGGADGTGTSSLEQSAADYDDDGTEDLDGEDLSNSMEFSEFSCPVCNESFVDQSALDHHVNNHPLIKTFVCQTCGKSFATRRYLKYHRKNHCKRAGSYEGRSELEEGGEGGELKRFVCNVCSRPFRVLKCMKVHKKKKHGITKDHTCHNCAITFSTSQELIRHVCDPSFPPAITAHHHQQQQQQVQQVQQQQQQQQAPAALTPAMTPPSLLFPSHKRKKKLKQVRPMCDICGKTFGDRISLDIHRTKHIEEELYPCDMCSEEAHAENPNHLAVLFRIKFFTDDNQHILEEQKAALGETNRSEDGSSACATPVHTPGTPAYAASTPTQAQVVDHTGATVEQGALLEGQYVVDQSQQGQGPYTLVQTDRNFMVNENGLVVDETGAVVTSDQMLLLNQAQPGANNPAGQAQVTPQTTFYSEYTGEEVVTDPATVTVLSEEPLGKKKPSSSSSSSSGGKKLKVHSCDICNKTFSDTAKLELHYKTNHLEDRPFQCDICDKSFFTKWKLQRHMLSHLEQKPHSCPACEKSFVERGKLEAHYRTHLGTKPFKCDHCGKAFTVKSQLTIHVRRIHSEDQPFACQVCGKAFLWKSGLDKHMRKHTREKPYVCSACGQKYSQKSNLIAHLSKVHNEVYVEKSGQGV